MSLRIVMEVEQAELDALMAALHLYGDQPAETREGVLRDTHVVTHQMVAPRDLPTASIRALRDRLHLCTHRVSYETQPPLVATSTLQR